MPEPASTASIYYALAEARFNRIANMVDYFPRIQDRLRHEGFPLYEERTLSHGPSWRMTQADKKAGYFLQPWSFVYQTTHFDSHDTLFNKLLSGLKIINKVVKLDHVTHLYVRCLDAILPKAGESVADYLADGFHGFTQIPGYQSSQSEFVFHTQTGPLRPQGTIVLRIFQVTGPLGFPSDLAAHDLLLRPEYSDTESISHAVADTDHFVQGMMPLDFIKLNKQLQSLFMGSRELFTKMTTDHARRVRT